MYELRDFSAIAVEAHLAGDISNVSDTFTLDSATGWPTGDSNGNFLVRIENEVIRCSSRTGNTCTVAGNGRGYDGTSAVGHAATVVAEHVLSKTDLYEANQAVVETIGKVTGPGQILVGDGVNSFSALANGGPGLPLVAGATTPAYGQLATGGYGDDTVTEAKLAPLSVGTPELIDDSVTNDKIGPLAVTGAEINTSVAGSGLSGGGGGPLAVNVDGQTLGIVGDALEVTAAYKWQSGDLKISARSTPTGGWLLCDGTAVSRITYADLFTALGTTYGVGDNTSTFNVPDYRGRTILGAGTGTALTARSRGDTGGFETHTLTSAEMPSHNHTQDAHNHTQNAHLHAEVGWDGTAGGSIVVQLSVNGSAGTLTAIDNTIATTATNNAATATNQATGGGGAHNNMQPFGVANVFIKI